MNEISCENKTRPIDCLRVLIHFWIFFMHYVGSFYIDYGPQTHFNILFKQFTIIFNIFSITFTINGYNCGKWFAKNMENGVNFFILSKKFYFQRIVSSLPLIYLNIITVGFFMYFIFQHELASNSFVNGLKYNLLLINNLVGYDKNVS